MLKITKPQSKIDKIAHLIKIAEHLNITSTLQHGTLFNQLMDKYENNYLMFDYMIENINACIFDKAPIESTKTNFLELLKIDNYNELIEAQVSEKLYEPSKLDYE